jgi:tetratricopeptide (TPR) repeat protein
LSRIRPLFPADAQARAARLALLAMRLARQERYGEALTRFDQAILLDPLCAAFHDARGVLLSLLRREQEALASFASAITLARGEQEQALIYFHRGLLYGRRREYDQALLDMKRAERLDPANQTYQEAVEQIRREKNQAEAQPAP